MPKIQSCHRCTLLPHAPQHELAVSFRLHCALACSDLLSATSTAVQQLSGVVSFHSLGSLVPPTASGLIPSHTVSQLRGLLLQSPPLPAWHMNSHGGPHPVMQLAQFGAPQQHTLPAGKLNIVGVKHCHCS